MTDYIRHNEVSIGKVRILLKDDDLYNKVANMIGWNLALPRDQDRRQNTLPFIASWGNATPKRTEPEKDDEPPRLPSRYFHDSRKIKGKRV